MYLRRAYSLVPTGVRIALLAGALVLAMAAAASAGNLPGGPGPGLADCGPGKNSTPTAQLDVPNGAAVLKHVPNLAYTPEISDASGPLHDGPLHLVLYA